MKIRVETYDGYRACERPLRFRLGEKRREVVEVLDRWFGEDHDYFKVLADDGGVYVLRCGRGEGGWELTQYRAAGTGSVEEGRRRAPSRGPLN
ncbi:MAG: hypothetical protein IPI61_14980 [Syntrophaceae bacterium]|nr:hypothetical protein [Syntrophaceae bacterium]